MDRLVGAFIFPEVWQGWTRAEATKALESLRGFGVNTLCTESDTYRDDLITLAHGMGLRWFGGIACFSDHARQYQVLRHRPEMWPIDETGVPRPQMEWYVGLTPTFEDYNASRLDLAERLVRAHQLDGFFLDFIRWPIHWELELRPGASRPMQSSFDPHTLARFQRQAGISLPADLAGAAGRAAWILDRQAQAWRDFRCGIITAFCEQAAARLRAVRGSELALGLYALPLPVESLEWIAGQRLGDLAPLVDLIAPMAYHAILHRPVEWVGETLQPLAKAFPGQVLPVLQVDSAEGNAAGADWGPPIPPDGWQEVVQRTLGLAGTRGLVAFTGTALFHDGRGERLRSVLEHGEELDARGDRPRR